MKHNIFSINILLKRDLLEKIFFVNLKNLLDIIGESRQMSRDTILATFHQTKIFNCAFTYNNKKITSSKSQL